MSETLFARLKGYDPRRGQVLRRYAYRGIKIHEDRGWYRVPAEVGEYFRAVRQLAHDPQSPLAFDVCTEEEAREIESRETAEKASRSSPLDAAVVVTTEDLPRTGGRNGRR
jgi:hypothetical protein